MTKTVTVNEETGDVIFPKEELQWVSNFASFCEAIEIPLKTIEQEDRFWFRATVTPIFKEGLTDIVHMCRFEDGSAEFTVPSTLVQERLIRSLLATKNFTMNNAALHLCAAYEMCRNLAKEIIELKKTKRNISGMKENPKGESE